MVSHIGEELTHKWRSYGVNTHGRVSLTLLLTLESREVRLRCAQIFLLEVKPSF